MNNVTALKFGLMFGMVFATDTVVAQQDSAFQGRWDLDIHRKEGEQAGWMEVSKANGKLKVNYVGPVGDAAEAAYAGVRGDELEFLVTKDPNEGKDFDVTYKARLADGKLAGSSQATNGAVATFTGVRAPALSEHGSTDWGRSFSLFNGKDLEGWRFSGPKHANWIVKDGTLQNIGHGADLISDRTFRNFKLHLEFQSGPRSNSGLYLRGRYEVQIETDAGNEKSSHHTGGVYGFLAPEPEQPRKVDVWQTYDIVLVGRTLTVVQNGATVINQKIIPGITGGALDSREGDPGPIYLQGSERGITNFRNVVITPATN